MCRRLHIPAECGALSCSSNATVPAVAVEHADVPIAEGLAAVDIVVTDGKIAAHPAGRRRTGRYAADRSRRRHGLAGFVDMPHPSRQGPHLAAQAQSRRHLHGRARCRQRRPRGALVGRRRRAPHGFLAALRLRARHRRDPHPPRFARAAAPHLLAVFAEMRERWAAGSSCRRSSLVPLDASARQRLLRRARRNGRQSVAACSAASTCMVPDLDELLDDARSGRRASTASTSTSMSTRRTIRGPRRSTASPRPCCATGFTGKVTRRPLLLARRARPKTPPQRTIDRVAEAGIAVVSLPMCNMYLQDRDPRPHPALARRDAAPRAGGRRRRGRRRLRQHARPLLRLWRSRHARGVPRGGAHPASRPSARRLAGPRRHRDARRHRRPRRTWARIAAGAPADLVLFRAPQLDRAPVAPAVRPHRAAQRHARSTAPCPTTANSTTSMEA